jgi:peptidoglycan/LPS O-acetylase OafA/YrhL
MPTEYRSDIDALRGIAICAVLLYHVSSNVFPGGSLGVDLFFVISGYLIFGLIVTQISERSFAIRKFYLRRAFRLIPPLVLMLTATTVFAYLQFTPIALREYSQSMLGALTYSSNIYFLRETDYFGAINQQNFPLIHLWSLAVEEQFYLTIPILIVASLKGKISLKFSLTAVFALSLIGFLSLQTMGYERFAFYLAPFRAWEFCLGALAYIYRTELLFKLKQYATILQVASLVLVIASFFSFGKLGSYNFIFNFVVALGAFLAIIFGLENVILSNRWVTKSLKLVGKSSYSIYLWHFPILFAWRQIQPSPMSVLELTCYAALSIFIGIGSTVFFEAPLLRNVNSRRLLLFVICPSIVLIFVSVLMLLRDGFEQSYYTKRLSNPQQEIYSIVRPALLERERGIIDIKESRCEFTISKISELLTEYYSRHKNCLEQYGKPILISGDSHSFNLFNMIVEF